jgi:hypothetical protein
MSILKELAAPISSVVEDNWISLKMEAASLSGALVYTNLHDVISQNTGVFMKCYDQLAITVNMCINQQSNPSSYVTHYSLM